MAVVAPCITVETAEDYKVSIERLAPFATRIHVDISDGEFAPSFLVGEDQLYWPTNWQVDIHAMLARPSEHLDRLIALKPYTIIFHAEVTEDRAALIAKIRAAGIRVGVALLKTTVPNTVADVIRQVDHVMIFSGTLGTYGGQASMMQLEKIRLVKAINPKAEIGWDGGVSLENAYTLVQGGVDVLNSGGAIAKAEDPAAAYAALMQETTKHGVI